MNIDEPNTRAGYCPVCNDRANIWAESKWHCRTCNWFGLNVVYQVHQSVLDKLEVIE